MLGVGCTSVLGRPAISTGGFILVSDYVRMEVTLVGASWDVVAGDQTGVDFIPMKFCGVF